MKKLISIIILAVSIASLSIATTEGNIALLVIGLAVTITMIALICLEWQKGGDNEKTD